MANPIHIYKDLCQSTLECLIKCGKDGTYSSVELVKVVCSKYKYFWQTCYQTEVPSDHESILSEHIESCNFSALFELFGETFKNIRSPKDSMISTINSGITYLQDNLPSFNHDFKLMDQISACVIMDLFNHFLGQITPTDKQELISMYECICQYSRSCTLDPACVFLAQLQISVLKYLIEMHDKDCKVMFTKDDEYDKIIWLHNSMPCHASFYKYATLDVIVSQQSFHDPKLIERFVGSFLDLDTFHRMQPVEKEIFRRIQFGLLRKIIHSLKPNYIDCFIRQSLSCEANLIRHSVPVATNKEDFFRRLFENNSELQWKGIRQLDFVVGIPMIDSLVKKKCFMFDNGNSLLHLFCKVLGESNYERKVKEYVSDRFDTTSDTLIEQYETEMILKYKSQFKSNDAEHFIPIEFRDLIAEPSNNKLVVLLFEILKHCDPNEENEDHKIPLEYAVTGNSLININDEIRETIIELISKTMHQGRQNEKVLTSIFRTLICSHEIRDFKFAVDEKIAKTVLSVMDPDCDVLFSFDEKGESFISYYQNTVFMKLLVEHLKTNYKNINSPVGDVKYKQTLLIGLLKKLRFFKMADKSRNYYLTEIYIELFQDLISIPNIDIEARDGQGWTAAYHAAMTLHPEIVNIIITVGRGSVAVENKHGTTLMSCFSQFDTDTNLDTFGMRGHYNEIMDKLEEQLSLDVPRATSGPAANIGKFCCEVKRKGVEFCGGVKRKAVEDNTSVYELFNASLLTASQSVGIIMSPWNMGTGFRVGDCYLMTCYHVVEAILKQTVPIGAPQNPLLSPGIFVSFDYREPVPLQLQPSVRYTLDQQSPLVWYNRNLDVAVLKLDTGGAAVHPVPKLDKFEPITPAIKQIHIVGHPDGNAKRMDYCCKIVRPTAQQIQTLVSWSQQTFGMNAYQNVDHPDKMLYHVSDDTVAGSSGAPGFICGSNQEACIAVMHCFGYPELQAAAAQVPTDKTVEQGVLMTAVYNDMLQTNPQLCTNIF